MLTEYNLYLTADSIGGPTGGGVVTYHESVALASLGKCDTLRPSEESLRSVNPFDQDLSAREQVDAFIKLYGPPRLAHIYAGCFSETVALLKKHGVKVTYTAAAHDIERSMKEHQVLGIEFNYPHLTDSTLWAKYLAGYKAADVLICPSNHSYKTMRKFGCQQNIAVIPHGNDVRNDSPPKLPERLTVGYLGSFGPDKGIRILLEAWRTLSYKDASLILAGRDSLSGFAYEMVQRYGGGNIHFAGWQKSVSSFFNSISLYVQPSLTEGFGIEVLEAMAHGRGVICSDGAGAVDVIGVHGCSFRSGDFLGLAGCIDQYKNKKDLLEKDAARNLEESKKYSWSNIRQTYALVWKNLFGYGTEVSDR